MRLYFYQVFMNLFPTDAWIPKKMLFPFISLLGKCIASVLKVQSVQYTMMSENSFLYLSCLKLLTSFARISNSISLSTSPRTLRASDLQQLPFRIKFPASHILMPWLNEYTWPVLRFDSPFKINLITYSLETNLCLIQVPRSLISWLKKDTPVLQILGKNLSQWKK